MKRILLGASFIIGVGAATLAQNPTPATDRTADRLATAQMIKTTWDVQASDEVSETPGGPLIAAMRAGFIKWKGQLATGDNTFFMNNGKNKASYAMEIKLLDLEIKEEAFRRGALRNTPDFAQKDRAERIRLNQSLTASDLSTIVAATNKLDSKTVAEWMAVRETVKKQVAALLASNPELRQQLADGNESAADVLASRNQLNRLLSAAGWKGR